MTLGSFAGPFDVGGWLFDVGCSVFKAFDWQAAFPELASTAEVEPAAKRRKRRKEGKRSSNEAAWAAGLTYPTQRVLLQFHNIFHS